MIGGHMGKLLFVDLGGGQIRVEEPDDALYRDFLGGYGLGARVIYGRQPSGVDPLGPEATLGFCTGVLVGSPAITPNRWTVVGKSPLTGGWGDANCGGYWGPMLKAAGFDAVFVKGIADRPTYLFVEEGAAELRDASDLWGVDALEAELRLRERYPKSQSAVIGPAAEKLSLMSGVVNDEGRIAARSGLGAVMGAKRLKAIVCRGTAPLPMADATRANEIRRRFIREMAANPKVKYFTKYGTINHTASSAFGGDSPIRNWGGSGLEDFPTAEAISDDTMLTYEYKKYACWKCNIACGGHYRTDDAAFPVGKTHKPEYETSALWGNNLLNDNIHSIIKANDLCNRYGLDTISTGSVIGFAIECYERGLLTNADTDGIELRWGDAAAIMALADLFVDLASRYDPRFAALPDDEESPFGVNALILDGRRVALPRDANLALADGAELHLIPAHRRRLSGGRSGSSAWRRGAEVSGLREEDLAQLLLVRRARQGDDLVSGCQLGAAGGEDRLAAADDDRDGRLGRQVEVAERHAGQWRSRRQRRLDDLDVGIPQPHQRDQGLGGDLLLDDREDDVGAADRGVDPEQAEDPVVLRIVDPGHGAGHIESPLGHLADDQVRRVLPRHGDDDVGAVRAGFGQDGGLVGHALVDDGVAQVTRDLGDLGGILLDDQDLVALRDQLARQVEADLPATRHDDVHGYPFSPLSSPVSVV